MKAPHPVFLAAMRLDGLGQAMLAKQPVAISGLALTEMAAVLYAAATEIRELRAQAEAESSEIESLRQEHETLRLAADASDGPIRRLRNRIYDLVSQLEARQQADLYTPVIRQEVEKLRDRATQHRAARAALAQAGGEG